MLLRVLAEYRSRHCPCRQYNNSSVSAPFSCRFFPFVSFSFPFRFHSMSVPFKQNGGKRTLSMTATVAWIIRGVHRYYPVIRALACVCG